MTITELVEILNESELSVRYGFAEAGVKLPFIFYTYTRGTAQSADDKSFVKKAVVEINLQTESKAQQLEMASRLEAIFDAHNLPYGDPDEGWDDDERIYLLTYTMEVYV